jgi:putative toxin-antitoxin system antitoxin component (TIGR02293 family)
MSTVPKISTVLGGPRALKSRPKSSRDWHSLISKGSPIEAADSLKLWLSLQDLDLARLLGVSEKTLSRWRIRHGKLDPVSSDRLYRVARIAALAGEVLENRAAAVSWLERPQVGLGNRKPLDLLTTAAGADEVEKLLIRIEHGVYS